MRRFFLSYLRAYRYAVVYEDDLYSVGSVCGAYHSVAVNASQLYRLEICYELELFADKVLGLVILSDTRYYLTSAHAVVKL